jgi:hypothetical protein
MPSSVYVLSAPAMTLEIFKSFEMLGSATASIWRSMPSTTMATNTPIVVSLAVRSNVSAAARCSICDILFDLQRERFYLRAAAMSRSRNDTAEARMPWFVRNARDWF